MNKKKQSTDQLFYDAREFSRGGLIGTVRDGRRNMAKVFLRPYVRLRGDVHALGLGALSRVYIAWCPLNEDESVDVFRPRYTLLAG